MIIVVNHQDNTAERILNVKHISVVGSWVYITLTNGAWFKVDAGEATIEIDAA